MIWYDWLKLHLQSICKSPPKWCIQPYIQWLQRTDTVECRSLVYRYNCRSDQVEMVFFFKQFSNEPRVPFQCVHRIIYLPRHVYTKDKKTSLTDTEQNNEVFKGRPIHTQNNDSHKTIIIMINNLIYRGSILNKSLYLPQQTKKTLKYNYIQCDMWVDFDHEYN